MMKQVERISCLVALVMGVVGGGMLVAEEKTKEPPKKEVVFSPENIARISETYGHFIVKSLDNPVLHLNFDSVVKGMQEAKAGKPSPLNEQEYEEAISQVHECSFREMSEKNLKEADAFLAKNVSEKGVVELEKGKLQMTIMQPGQGEVLTEELIPVFHYSGKYLDGTSFGNSYDAGEPVSINLKTVIPGFRKGVLGMKVGEKRKLFIHPDLGYGTSGQLLPNALLVFEVELVKLNPITKEELASADDEDSDDDEDEDEDGDEEGDEDIDDEDEESEEVGPQKPATL
jgi:peptidylprolyl isomerase